MLFILSIALSPPKPKAPRNRTLELTAAEIKRYRSQLKHLAAAVNDDHVDAIANRIFYQDALEVIPRLPQACVDLLIIDPPYNRRKQFNQKHFYQQTPADYLVWFESWFVPLMAVLKPTASVYVCADWQSSAVIYPVLQRHLQVQNRITWEREKGRGAKNNWKNSSEDIWFCTRSQKFHFNVEAVKLKRRVLAPYRDPAGQPKDWQQSKTGRFRVTYPSNLWTDISVPFWSMPENTEHPTQKPEKLVAKLILASSQPGDLVLDPFLGSGTTAVVAKKLNRRYVGIEIDETYCCLAQKRLHLAEQNQNIQGYTGGYFWDRNTSSAQGQPSSN